MCGSGEQDSAEMGECGLGWGMAWKMRAASSFILEYVFCDVALPCKSRM